MKKFNRWLLTAILAWLLLLGGITEAAGLNTPISARFDDYYLDDAIVLVANGTGMSWLTFGEIKGSVSIAFDNLDSAQALDIITKQNNLVWQANRGIIVVQSVTKEVIDTRVAYNLTKCPLSSMLQVIADALQVRLVVRGKLTGEVTEAYTGTMKEAVNLLAAKHRFKWSIDDKVFKVYAAR